MEDGLPELTENFQLILASVYTSDGRETTSTSGASIDVHRAISNLTLTKNDLPNGLLQFSSTGIRIETDSLLPISSVQPQVFLLMRMICRKGYVVKLHYITKCFTSIVTALTWFSKISLACDSTGIAVC